MKSRFGQIASFPPRASRIALCRHCRRQILPQRKTSSLLQRDAHRAAAKGMKDDKAPDPRAARIKARKDRKNQRLAGARARGQLHTGRQAAVIAALRAQDGEAAARVVLEIRGERLQRAPVDEECNECRGLQRTGTD